MNDVKIKVWCAKWAYAKGVLEVEGYDLTRGTFQVRVADGTHYYLHDEGKEWHRTEYSALNYAAQMADKKIAKLKNQIKQLEMNQARFQNRCETIRSECQRRQEERTK